MLVTQWVAGFGLTMRDEPNPEVKQNMFDYMISLMGDANDFSWISTKASHAVLLCYMEQGEVISYSDTMAIDRILTTNAQNHVNVSQSNLIQIPFNGKNMAKPQNLYPAHISIRVHVYRKNPIRPGGSL